MLRVVVCLEKALVEFVVVQMMARALLECERCLAVWCLDNVFVCFAY